MRGWRRAKLCGLQALRVRWSHGLALCQPAAVWEECAGNRPYPDLLDTIYL